MWPILRFLSGLVYKSETIRTIIAEETMYESSIAQYFTEKGIEQGSRERAVEDLLQDVLEIRFGLSAADPLAARIRSHRGCATPQAVASVGHTGTQP